MNSKIADVKLGYSCNNDCLHCVISSQRKNAIKLRGKENLNTEEYLYEIDKSIESGSELFVLTGGEPTIRPDFLQIVEYIASKNKKIILQTNGRKLSDNNLVSALSKYSILYVVAIHSNIAETHDYISQRSGSFRETVIGLKCLVEQNQPIIAKCVISNYNYKQLVDIAAYLVESGVKNLMFSFPHGEGNAWENRDNVIPTYEKIQPYIFECIRYIEDINKNNLNIKLRFETIPFCYLKEGQEKYIQEWYSNRDCGIELKQLDTYDTIDWLKKRKDIKIKAFKRCKNCMYGNKCEGVWTEYIDILKERDLCFELSK